ncbi:hypothetical protein O181_098377 [Austropuccinia psidii MF-1]|uniref:Uncharacterized protein n=1 Tax=Austropuccinia psidii MF-1 TaxID=1389203 RepID=A0A9Q3JB42_9BASI|nr:hypothetical protein [Austropuccinia psidii MF-1]
MFLKEDEIVRYSNLQNPLSSKPQIKKVNDWHNKNREAIKEAAPVASTSKLQASQPSQKGKKNKKKNWSKPYFLSYKIPRIQKYSMDNVFNMTRNLMEFKDKEKGMIKPHFQKKELFLLML